MYKQTDFESIHMINDSIRNFPYFMVLNADNRLQVR